MWLSKTKRADLRPGGCFKIGATKTVIVIKQVSEGGSGNLEALALLF